VIDFFNRFLRPAPPSGATAKERLRLVLLSDHISLAPDVIEALKRDLLLVISKYVEIDRAHADVTFEHREGEVAMLASIPITGVRERTRAEAPEPEPEPEPALAVAAPATLESRMQPGEAAPAAPAPPAAPTTPRRRRRRKSSAAKRAAQQQAMSLGNTAQA
jgi:cell division topological specificity factor